jgi:urea transport system substrate-binding protein
MGENVATIPVGLLYSHSGPYAHMGTEMMKGAILAIEEINASDLGFRLSPVIADPGGDPERYEAAFINMIRQQQVVHIVGCYTSASRKQVLPHLARNNVLLWHPARYEGFEACENIIYAGAAPNQHVVPLARYMIEAIGRDVFCVGTNYIWTWETNRVLREIVGAAGGSIIGERVIAFGNTDVAHLVDAVLEKRPQAIFNTLVGETSYAFVRAWHAARVRYGLDIPILSCSLNEHELKLIGPDASVGHISTTTYFASLDRPENHAFVQRYRRRFGADQTPFNDAEASYVSIMLLGRAIARAGSASVSEVQEAVYCDRFEAPHGPIWLDRATNHSYHIPRIAISRPGFEFNVFWEADAPVRPDPYLINLDVNAIASGALGHANRSRKASHLRVVK